MLLASSLPLLIERQEQMSRVETLVTVTGNNLGESAKAIRFEITHISGEPLEKPVVTWFPISQTRKIFKNPNVTGEDTLTVTEWIMIQKELI